MEVSKLKKRTKQDGMTLVEVLCAMLILSFVMVTVVYALVYRIHSFKKTREKTTAIVIAQSAIEEINKYPSTAIPSAQKYYVAKNGENLIRSESKPKDFTELYEVNATNTTNSSSFGMLYDINVTVKYAYMRGSGGFLGNIVLNTQRGR